MQYKNNLSVDNKLLNSNTLATARQDKLVSIDNSHKDMVNLIDDDVITVSEFVSRTNLAISSFGIASIICEISSVKFYNQSCFFTIKDENASVDCLIFVNKLSQLNFELKTGIEVIVHGRPSLYKNGSFRLIVERIEQFGVGKLMLEYDALKRKLETQGLFNICKRPIPKFVNKVGVITSKEGAVVHDIEMTIASRNNLVELKVFDARVQGDAASKSLIAALKEAYQDNSLDVLIIGRGGGSFEDLFCFNDEELCNTIVKSPIPIISSVGHETDFTLCDFVCDKRAPTPTAAATYVTSITKEDLLNTVLNYEGKLNIAIQNNYEARFARTKYLYEKLEKNNPLFYLNYLSSKLKILDSRCAQLLVYKKNNLQNSLNHLADRLEKNSPKAKHDALLNKAFAIYLKLNNEILRYQNTRVQFLNYYKERFFNINLDLRANEYLNRILMLENRLNNAILKQQQVKYDRVYSYYLRINRSPLFDWFNKTKEQFAHLNATLVAQNPLSIISKGYSVTYLNGKIAKINEIKEGDFIVTTIKEGQIESKVTKITYKK